LPASLVASCRAAQGFHQARNPSPYESAIILADSGNWAAMARNWGVIPAAIIMTISAGAGA